ncbi:hypothetical protein [Mesorhizobium sp.]|uniref:helix-turn-helix transcriptional regulator n=1 Tax=Mesorhizobium sp. TaxID=1871066 RepID=UPI0012118296|nr:hypothetical protein [Mesorhizobium sp.]TIQ98008.1 MAG: hypothetical protein E5X36_10305 [Mesorhizobium sp.]
MIKSKAQVQGSRPSFRLALSRNDLAIAIGVSTSSIDVMVTEGALPPPRKWHSRKLWLIAEVEAHLNEWPVDGEERTPNQIDAILDRHKPQEQQTGPGGYAIPSGNKDDWLQRYYDRLGFDPHTMGHDEMRELHKAAEQRWLASIPGSPLLRLERQALTQLAEHGPSVQVNTRDIKNCGPNTQDRLRARGYLETVPHHKYPESVGALILTDAGYAAFRELDAKQS